MNKPKVLVVDDELEIREGIRDLLENEFETFTAADGLEALDGAREKKPDLILLDLMMPRMSGLEACKVLREDESTKHIPVFILTAYHSLDHKVKAFENGADDFLAKPFEIEELMARLKAKMRRLHQHSKPKDVLSFGPAVIDVANRQVTMSGNLIHLTRIEFKLLALLASHPYELVTQKQILTEIWKDESKPQRLIDTQISLLRKKLQGSNIKIRSVYGAGYILEESKA
jgi:DNA-binding response OmpR family regulator